MNITKKMNNGILEVSVEGRLDTSNATQLDDELKGSINEADALVMDFSKLDYISSAGLRVLLSANKNLVKRGKEAIKVTNANDIVKEVFEVTGFSDILNIA